MTAPAAVAVLLAWSAQRRDVDPLTGVVTDDRRSDALSSVDEAALEVGLRLGEAWGLEVVACSAGSPTVEGALRLALATGATRAWRVETDGEASAAEVAAALADPLRTLGGVLVIAGSHGVDFGSGAVPAFVAHELGAAQALGLVEVHAAQLGVVEGVRRADRGVRERVRAQAPAVLSVEGSAATLRRASLKATLDAPSRRIEVMHPTTLRRDPETVRNLGARRYRPRTHIVTPPEGGDALARIRQLTGAATPRTPPRTLELDPGEAAEAILDQLGEWGLGPRADDRDV